MRRRKLTSEEKKRILRERSYKIYLKLALIFIVVILVVTVLNLAVKDKSYSETENRKLAQWPQISLNSLADGRFMTEVEDYVTDQFFLRDQWIKLKLGQDMLMGRRESNGVYLGKNGYLIEIPDTPDMDAVDRNLRAIHDFAARQAGVNTVMALVPNAVYVCEQNLPSHAPVRDQGEDISHARSMTGDVLNFIDLTDTMLMHSTEEIYYKTDHHWTSLGAQYAFETLSSALGIQNPVHDYKVYPVTHSFSGTLASKSGYGGSEDTIEIYVPVTTNLNYVVNYTDTLEKSASIYDSAALEKKDKYEVFFGGNHMRVDISTPLPENKNLLLIKDSYANCFVQFLTPYFRNIIMIDPRYFYESVDKLVSDYGITDILFLYNVNTFMTDTSIADVLEE